MSILIRGMEIPKYTTKAEFGIDADGNPLCMVYHEDGTEPDIYDIFPLPEGHGRLIDGTDLFGVLDGGFDVDLDDLPETKDAILCMIASAETIIEAEGGGEDG